MLRNTGAVLSLLFFETLFSSRVASAAAVTAAAKPPVRLGIFTVTGGTVLESWTPQEAGPLEIGLNGGEKNYSFRSRDSVVPYEGNPRLTYSRIPAECREPMAESRWPFSLLLRND